MNLRIPGPIPVPEDILGEMSRPMINHRGPEYEELLFGVTERLKRVFETDGDVWIITGSGTSGDGSGGGEHYVAGRQGHQRDDRRVRQQVHGHSVGVWRGRQDAELPVRRGDRPGYAARRAQRRAGHNGGDGNAQRDFYGRGERSGGRRRRGQGRVRQAADSRWHKQRGVDPDFNGRLGAGRGGHGVAERLDGSARAGVPELQRTGLAGARRVEDAEILSGHGAVQAFTTRSVSRRTHPRYRSCSRWTRR